MRVSPPNERSTFAFRSRNDRIFKVYRVGIRLINVGHRLCFLILLLQYKTNMQKQARWEKVAKIPLLAVLA